MGGCGCLLLALGTTTTAGLVVYGAYLNFFVYTDDAPSRHVQRTLADAKAGYAEDQYEMGLFLTTGRENLPADPKAAREWFEKAAAQGHGGALYRLGDIYRRGRGVEPDLPKAVTLFREAEERGSLAARNTLGDLYFRGEGVPKNIHAAVARYRKAAEAEFPPALRNMGIMAAGGHGVTQNYDEARRWYVKAAELGDPVAYNNLGIMYERGQSVAVDERRAHACYSKASWGYEPARRNEKRVSEFGLNYPKTMDCLTGTIHTITPRSRVRK